MERRMGFAKLNAVYDLKGGIRGLALATGTFPLLPFAILQNQSITKNAPVASAKTAHRITSDITPTSFPFVLIVSGRRSGLVGISLDR